MKSEPAPLAVVGTSVEKLDILDKARGKALYASDLSLPGMLFARPVRSPHAHARLLSVDTAKALEMPGVVAVLTAKDIPGQNLVGSRGVRDQPVLAVDKVRFLGEPVALAIGRTPEAARVASDKVEAAYELLGVVSSPVDALDPSSPLVASEGNLCYFGRIRRGDFAATLRDADVVVRNTYRTSTVDHAFLEPHAAVAAPRESGGITAWITTKTVHPMQEEISRVLGLPREKIRVISATVGGSFGGKPDITCGCLAALGALHTGRPVKLVYSREECMQTSYKRHAYVVEYTHAADRDGRLLGVKVDLYADAGAYTSESKAVVARAIIHAAGPYHVPNVDVEGRAVFTNNPNSGAMRGYGVPQVAFAHEIQMDILAAQLGIDPIELRLRNILKPGLTMITGQAVPEGVGAEACLRRMQELLSREPASAPDPSVLAGWGVACFYYGNGRTAVEDTGRCSLCREADGTFTLYVGVPDVGQGSTTVLAQIACEELGVPWRSVKVVAADTDLTLETGPASATRVTVVVGRAVQDACRRMNHLARGSGASEPLEVKAEYRTDSTPLDDNGQGSPYGTYTYGVQAANVEVDPATGKTRVRKVIAVNDVGTVINPALFAGQVQGGIAGSIGWALHEDVHLDKGRVAAPDFHTYLLPVAPDAPEVVLSTVPSTDGAGPFASKGIGEPAAVPTAPAVANAIHQATGVRMLELPITMERVYEAIIFRRG